MNVRFFKTASALLLLLFTLAAPTHLSAKDSGPTPPENYKANFEKKIHFERGRTTAILKGQLKGKGDLSDAYLIRVKKGQVMSLKVISPNNEAGLTVYSPSGDLLYPDENVFNVWKETLEESGEYKIFVSNLGSKNLAYTLEVVVP